jgi:hypothetical protein
MRALLDLVLQKAFGEEGGSNRRLEKKFHTEKLYGL